MAVESILPQVAPGATEALRPEQQTAGDSDFDNRLEAAIRSVSDAQNGADVQLAKLASGEEVDIHTTMIAMQEADISLRLMVSARDKVVEAYQQVMNMTI